MLLSSQEGMHSIGVNTAEMRIIKRILSAILHLGNVSFKDNGEGHLPSVDGEKARLHMEWACELLGIDKVRDDVVQQLHLWMMLRCDGWCTTFVDDQMQLFAVQHTRIHSF